MSWTHELPKQYAQNAHYGLVLSSNKECRLTERIAAMQNEAEYLLIDDQLRFVLFGLECALNVEFNSAEVERLFDDAEGGNASFTPRQYVLHTSRGLHVAGCVEEHEPETIRLNVESRHSFAPSLAEIRGRAQYQAYRIARHLSAKSISACDGEDLEDAEE